MTIIQLTEYSEISVPLSDIAGRALASSRVVDATPDAFTVGYWVLRAKGTVGVAVIHVPDGSTISLRISPKIPIARLLFLLGFSRNAKGWRTENVQVSEDRELLPAIARLFAGQADEALRQGRLKGYRSVDETALVMRGRVRMTEQARRYHGRLVPLELTHDEFTEDIAENRLIRGACERLLRAPRGTPSGIPGDVHGRLLKLRTRLNDITPIRRGTHPPSWQPSRLNSRYHSALRLADIVLRGASVEHRPGDVTASGFLFNMARIFEDFVTAALQEELVGAGGHCVLQARHHLDERRAISIIPDFVRYADNGSPLAVADAKYKAEQPSGFPDADIYQMLAYCTALNLRSGHLIYAKGNAEQGSHRVRYAGITIHQHALNLDQSPAELRQSIENLARLLVG